MKWLSFIPEFGTVCRTRAAWQTQQAGLVTVTVGDVTPVYGGGGAGGNMGDSINTSAGSISTDTLDVECRWELSSAIVESATSATGGSTRSAAWCLRRRRICTRACRGGVFFGITFGDGIGNWSPSSNGLTYSHTDVQTTEIQHSFKGHFPG